MRFSMNRIVIDRKKEGYHLKKNALFDLLNLANKLYRLKSSYLKSPKHDKIYFLKNQISNLLNKRKKYLP